MYKYYDSFYFQNEETSLDSPSLDERFIKSYYADALNLKVSELFIQNKIKYILYHQADNLKQIESFHQKHYDIDQLKIIQQKSAFTFFIETYKEFELESFSIFKFDKHQREIESLLFDKNYTLTQYNESIYANEVDELPVTEKLFYPQIWKIHIEEMDE